MASMLGRVCGWWWTAALLVAFAALPPAPAGNARAQAACDYQILQLGDVVQQAPLIVLADAIREQRDLVGGYTTTVRVLGALKGRMNAPELAVGNLGHLDIDCQGGPRLPRGGRYVLFLTRAGNDPSSAWSLVDQEGGVYQLTSAGVRFPPAQTGGPTQLLPIPAAEFIRDVGDSLLRDDPARIESLISDNQLPETLPSRSAATAAPAEKPWYERLPRRGTAVAVAGLAVLLASLTYLLWRPAPVDPYRRS
ncbi:MAG TPA: hypothetical protein VFA70_12675 [Dehalococcoidia bacterium]|nr:hypothetical protein [Dehalococcoidia bacterium]